MVIILPLRPISSPQMLMKQPPCWPSFTSHHCLQNTEETARINGSPLPPSLKGSRCCDGFPARLSLLASISCTVLHSGCSPARKLFDDLPTPNSLETTCCALKSPPILLDYDWILNF